MRGQTTRGRQLRRCRHGRAALRDLLSAHAARLRGASARRAISAATMRIAAKPTGAFTNGKDQDQQAGEADAGHLMRQKSARAAEAEQERKRHRQHDQIISVEIRRRQHRSGAERRGLDLERTPSPRRGEGWGEGGRPTEAVPSFCPLPRGEREIGGLRHSAATAAAAMSATAICTVQASVSLPPSMRVRPNAVCNLLQSAQPSERNACDVWPILPKKACQLSVPNARVAHDAASAISSGDDRRR